MVCISLFKHDSMRISMHGLRYNRATIIFGLKRFGAIWFENLCEPVRCDSMRFDTLIFVRFREAEYQGEYRGEHPPLCTC